MFQDVDSTLKTLVDAATLLTDANGRVDVAVDFATPNEGYPAQVTGDRVINLYLYETTENRELRDPVPIIEKVNGRYRRRRPPIRVDCSYMVTAWSKDQGETRVGDEHAILGNALEWLSRFPLIPERVFAEHLNTEVEVLQGRLRVAPFAHPTMVAQLGDNGKSLGEFWSALDVAPRPSFNLVVTVALDPDPGRPEGPPVVSKGTKQAIIDPATGDVVPGTETESFWQIGGAVRAERPDPNPLLLPEFPIAGAKVAMPGLGLETKTDQRGMFSFRFKRRGTFAVRVEADGFAPQETNVDVPSQSTELHNLALKLDPPTLAGSVVDIQGNGIAGAEATLLRSRPHPTSTDPADREIAKVATAGDGGFVIDLAAAGAAYADQLQLIVRDANHEPAELEITVPVSSGALRVELSNKSNP